jgi:phage-related protein
LGRRQQEGPGRFSGTSAGDLGFALFELQQGRRPTAETRRMESIGAGVYELKEADKRAWYRVIYLSKIKNVIYVLHCFEKESRKTDKRDLAIAKERLSYVRRRIEEQRKHAKSTHK